jgi:putative sugar O-methyltransferase
MIRKILKKVLPNSFVNKYRHYNLQKAHLKTSLSDNEKYPDYCLQASNNMLVFVNFRQSNIYRQTLEHVTPQIGQLYLDEIKKTRKDLLKYMEKIKENDIYGNPDLVEYSDIGKICPSTLRYAKVLADLLNWFHTLDDLKICEIGVGYGGQCRIINAISKPAEYTLVDLKPVLSLAQRYLDGYVLYSTIKYKTMNELHKDNYDLVISNYAFSELRREIQDVYLEKIILNSKCGYLTYNSITPDFFGTYSSDELINIIPDSYIVEEKPLTHPKNRIIVWGGK